MALTELKVLTSIEILVDIKIANVLWVNKIMRNNVVISEEFERSSYDKSMKSKFIADVPDSYGYIQALGWDY